MMKGLVLLLAIALLVFAFSSTCLAGGAISVQWGDSSKPDSNDAGGGGKYKKKGGPPPHAPAHGYRAKHQYRYYPSCNVYHEPSTGIYFYLKGDGWAVGASLPTNLQSSLGASVSFDLDTDKPYEHNAEHLKQYPREKYKSGKQAKN
jgi:hypothetical protein